MERFNKKYAQIIAERKKRFLRGEDAACEGVPEHIAESWRLCARAGVDPVAPLPEKINDEELAVMLGKYRQLLDIARPVMEESFFSLHLPNSSICLVSQDGILLHMYHNIKDYAPFDFPGQIIREDIRGTGAMTMALRLRKSTECFATEHFCTIFENTYSSASPIFDSTGEIIAFISLSTVDPKFLPHIRMLSRSIVSSIATQLHLCLLLEENLVLINAIEDAVILLDVDQRVLRVNEKATSLLKLSETVDGEKLFSFLQKNHVLESIAQGTEFQNIETKIQTLEGSSLQCVASYRIFGGGKGILSLKEIGQMHEYASRVNGNRAVYHFEDIIGISPKKRMLIDLAKRAAQTDIPVLIQGESGTGKELLAHSMHNASPRRGKPFIAVNCGALPMELIQSELFGYSAGAFTGAKSGGNPGKFELADGGTLFLDEIGEMPLNAQVSLLRFLQDGKFTRLGGKTSMYADVKIIAATNRNLEEMALRKLFRHDLLYRLNAIVLSMPPLRECREDIPLLVNYFLERCVRNGNESGPIMISDNAMKMFSSYSWPGNIRELENAVEYSFYMSNGNEITPDFFPTIMKEKLSFNTINYDTKILKLEDNECDNSEKDAIVGLLKQCKGNASKAAKMLGISRSLLYRKLNKYSIHAMEYRNVDLIFQNSQEVSGRKKLEEILESLSQEKIERLVGFIRSL